MHYIRLISLLLLLLSSTAALLFVIDSTDSERLDEVYDELAALMSEKQLKDALLLFFANKQASWLHLYDPLSDLIIPVNPWHHSSCCGALCYCCGAIWNFPIQIDIFLIEVSYKRNIAVPLKEWSLMPALFINPLYQIS